MTLFFFAYYVHDSCLSQLRELRTGKFGSSVYEGDPLTHIKKNIKERNLVQNKMVHHKKLVRLSIYNNTWTIPNTFMSNFRQNQCHDNYNM